MHQVFLHWAGCVLYSWHDTFEPWETMSAAGFPVLCQDHDGGREKFLHLKDCTLTFSRATHHVIPLSQDWMIAVRILSILYTHLLPSVQFLSLCWGC